MKRHQWTNEELRFVLDSILLGYTKVDWNVLLNTIREDVGVSNGSIKALYKSFSKISQGIEPNPTKGGVGSNWGSNVEFAFNDWRSHHKLTQSKVNIIFS